MTENNKERVLKIAQNLYTKDSVMLLSSYPLLGSILSSLAKRFTYTVPTLGVSYNLRKGWWELAINPEFYSGISDDDKRFTILCHEAWHVILMHPIRMDGKVTPIKNIAADIIVNETIDFKSPTNARQIKARDTIPEGCFYETFGLTQEQDDTYEKVLERLKKNVKEVRIQATGNGKGETTDSHDWEPKEGKGEGDEEEQGAAKSLTSTKENADRDMREMINTAINSCSKEFGDLPAGIRNYITEALRPKVKWNKLLRIHGQNAVKYGHYYTVKKISRRYGFPFPGRRKRKGGLVVAAVDVSGSVSTEYKQQFLGELKSMANYVDLHIMTFDTRIIDSYPEWNKKIKLSDTCGGTDPQCVFDECAKIKPDKVVILTDGYFGTVDTRGYDTLFILTPDGEERSEGKCIKIS